MIKTIFFDWMGTLGKVDKEDFIGDYLGEESRNSLLVNSFKNADIPEDKIEVVKDTLEKAVLGIYEDTLETIKRLKQKGYSLSIISNMYPITTEKFRSQFADLLPYFDVVNLSAESGLRKPNKEIFFDTIKRLKEKLGKEIAPEEIMMIGNNKEQDFDAPLSIGLKARLINREVQQLKDILEEVDL